MTSTWTPKVEEIFAPRRAKLNSLKLELEKAENHFRSKTFLLVKLAEKLDNVRFIRHREETYNLTVKKIRELMPLMDEVNSCGFDRDAQSGFSVNLSLKFRDFVSTFESQNPGHFDEEKLMMEFSKEFERVKAEFEKENTLKELETYLEDRKVDK